jgi:hypothetical protein
MRLKTVSLLGVFVLALSPVARGQAAAPAAPAPAPAAHPTSGAAPAEAMLEIYQIDLDPSGTAFALGKPVLEGTAYVFKAWPERTVVHLDQTKVKKITQRTKNLDQEVVYQIDLVPTGRMIARESPRLKGTTYTFHTWRDGTLMSMRQADIKKITKVTGMAAFRIQQEERGAALNANLPMQGGGSVTILPSPGSAPAAEPAPAAAPEGNWRYEGQPGVTDAYAPPSAVVSSPGDVPKAAPQPTPQPR